MTAALVGLVVAAGLFLASRKRDELVTEVVLPAPPERVWAVLSDGARFGEWNPFIRAMDGELVPGGKLRNVMAPAGGREMTFTPTVLAVRPAAELRWLGRLLVPGLFDGEHYFLLTPTAGGTRLVHGERFRGIAFWFVKAESFRGDFERMNAALVARVRG